MNGMIIWGALYFLYVSIWFYMAFYCISVSKWPKVKARVVRNDVVKLTGIRGFFDQSGGYEADVLYEFEVGGVMYQGTRVSLAVPIGGFKGGVRKLLDRYIPEQSTHVQISYNPDKPNKSYVDGDVGLVAIICIVVAFLPLLPVIYFYFY